MLHANEHGIGIMERIEKEVNVKLVWLKFEKNIVLQKLIIEQNNM